MARLRATRAVNEHNGGDGERNMFDGVKVFSATKQKEREELGETITTWLRKKDSEIEIVDDAGTPGDASDDFSISSGDIVFIGGDDGDGNLEVGETWVYEATRTVTQDDVQLEPGMVRPVPTAPYWGPQHMPMGDPIVVGQRPA